MDIRFFEWLDRLKRGGCSVCLRGEKDDHTRLLTDELGVRIPPGAPIPPHLLYGRENDDEAKAARRAAIIEAVVEAEEEGLYEEVEHLSGSGAWLKAPKDGILPPVDTQEMMRLFDRFTVKGS